MSVLESVSLLMMAHCRGVNLALSLALGLFPVGEVDFLHVWMVIQSHSLMLNLALMGKDCLLLKILLTLIV